MTAILLRLTEEDLASRPLIIGKRRAEQLGLPQAESTIPVQLHEYTDHVQWDPRLGELRGEDIGFQLGLRARQGDFLRLRWDQSTLVMSVVDDTDASSAMARSVGSVTRMPATARPGPPNLHAGRRRRKPTPKRLYPAHDYSELEPGVTILQPSWQEIQSDLSAGKWNPPEDFRLRITAEKLACIDGFDDLVSLPVVGVDPMPHQLAATFKALRQLRGHAILADEVGLGKTIEAGLVAAELNLRGLVDSILVITPATLRDQWREELSEKFGIECRVVASGKAPLTGSRLIMSLHLARNLRNELSEREWDLIIVDEAHRLTGKTAKTTVEMMSSLRSRYRLFLTATPVQNDLLELHRLVELLKPGTLGTTRQFKATYVAKKDPKRPRNARDLRTLTSTVMIRTTRAQAKVDSVQRHIVAVPIQMPPAERRAYELMLHLLRTTLNGPRDHMRRRYLAQLLSNSPRGLYESASAALAKEQSADARDALRKLQQVAAEGKRTARQLRLIQLTREWIDDPGKGRVIIFTEHTRVLNEIVDLLAEDGIIAVAYHGGMNAAKKSASLKAFQGPVKVVVSTSAGAEGLNLQHANAVINYDLPWNPMRIEQRIGRVHRVTQKRDVYVANFFALGTVDERIYEILSQKLRMFELLFGQVTTILGNMDRGGAGKSDSLVAQLVDAVTRASDDEMDAEFERIGERAAQARADADAEIHDSGGVSSWLSPTLDTAATRSSDATELMPVSFVSDDAPQDQAVAFLREWLDHVGASIAVDDDDCMSVVLGPDVAEFFGSELLKIAFNRDGKARNPDAELFAIGTPLFDDLLASLSECGSLLAWTVPSENLHDLTAYPPLPAGELAFVERSVGTPGLAGGTVHWAVEDADSRMLREVVSTPWGQATPVAGVHMPAGDGSTQIPQRQFEQTPRALIKTAITHSQPALAAKKQSWQGDVDAAFEQQRNEAIDHYTREAVEAEGTKREELVLSQLMDKLGETAPQLELRARLLAMEFVSGTQVDVVDAWRLPDGRQVNVKGRWSAEDDKLVFSGDEGVPIGLVATCGNLHVIDAPPLPPCPRCAAVACPLCEPRFRVRHDCALCQRSVCGDCADEDTICAGCHRQACRDCFEGGLCRTCRCHEEMMPEDIAGLPPVLAAQGCRVWQGTERELRVLLIIGSQRREMAWLKAGGIDTWVNLADTPEDVLGQAIWATQRHGLCGDIVITQTAVPCDGSDPTGVDASVLAYESGVRRVWTLAGENIPTPASAQLPTAEPGPELLEVMASHPALIAPPDLPATAATAVTASDVQVAAWIWINRSGLHVCTRTGHEETKHVGRWEKIGARHRTADNWATPALPGATDAESSDRGADPTQSAAGDWVALRTVTEDVLSIKVERHDGNPLAVVAHGSVRTCFGERDVALDAASDATASLDRWALEFLKSIPPMTHTTQLTFSGRKPQVSPLVSLEYSLRGGSPELDDDRQHLRLERPTDDGDLTVAELNGIHGFLVDPPHRNPIDLAGPLIEALEHNELVSPQEWTIQSIGLNWRRSLPIVETWTSTSGARMTVPGEADLNDGRITLQGREQSTFAVLDACDEAHAVDASEVSVCPGCGARTCPTCPETTRARSECAVCDDTLCSSCLPASQRCTCCDRPACRRCTGAHNLCRTCAEPTPLDPSEIERLPSFLQASGLSAAASEYPHLKVIHLLGEQRREVLFQDRDTGEINQWLTLGEARPELLSEALEVCREIGVGGDVVIAEQLRAADPMELHPDHDFAMARNEEVRTRWLIGDRVVAVPGVPDSRPTPRPPDSSDLGLALRSVSVPTVPTRHSTHLIRETLHMRDDVWLNASGLHRRRELGSDVQLQSAPWSKPNSDVALMSVNLPTGRRDVPTRLRCELDGVSASLGEMAGRRLLRIASPDQPDVVWDIDGIREVFSQVLTGLTLFDMFVPVDLRPWSDVSQPLPVPRPGVLRHVSSHYLAVADFGDGQVHRRIVHEWPTPVHLEGVEPLLDSPIAVRNVASALAVEPIASRVAEVGVVMTADFRSADGQVRADYGVVAGISGLVLASPVDLSPMPGASICDEGHLRTHVDDCIACRRRTCDACPVEVLPCVVCAVPMCSHCTTQGVCHACSNLKPVTRFEALRLRLRIRDLDTAVMGQDAGHTVYFVKTTLGAGLLLTRIGSKTSIRELE